MRMKKRVLIIYNDLLDYRRPFFEELSRHCELYVLVSQRSRVDGDMYNTLKGSEKKIGPFTLRYNTNIKYEDFDVIIHLLEFEYLFDILKMIFYLHKKRSAVVCSWGLWPTQRFLINTLRFWFARKCDMNLFYCREHLEFYRLLGVPSGKLRVLRNTVDDSLYRITESNPNKNNLRFVSIGSIDYRKGFIEIAKLLQFVEVSFEWIVIGDGPQRAELDVFCKSNNIHASFKGRVTSSEIISQLFSGADACLTLNQAGLSVLTSLKCGTPVLGLESAISGGEKFAIYNGFNGYLFNHLEAYKGYLRKDDLKICLNNMKSLMMNSNVDYSMKKLMVEPLVNELL